LTTFSRSVPPLLLDNEAPRFVQLDPADLQAAHQRVGSAAVADVDTQAHDRVVVDTSQPLDRSD
jgi:hypothetical protein